MRRYLIDSGVRVVFEAVERPKGEYKDFAQPLNEGLAHERFVTAHICAVYEQAPVSYTHLALIRPFDHLRRDVVRRKERI